MKFFLDKTITIRRLQTKSGNRTAFSATGTVWAVCIQEPNPEITQLYDGQIGQLYEMFLDDAADIHEADQVVYNGVKYSVKDVKSVNTSWGSTNYKRLIVMRKQ